MPIYCDESGGIGRGVMTLAAVRIEEVTAEDLLLQYRKQTGLVSELKGSRIELPERALLLNLLTGTSAKIAVSIAISALTPEKGEDRGLHDIEIYAQLMNDAIGALISGNGECTSVIMDAGRYDDKILSAVRRDVAELIGPWNAAQMVESHRLAGLQIADVIANSFFNRAFVSKVQSHMAKLLQPMLDSGQIELRLLSRDPEDDD